MVRVESPPSIVDRLVAQDGRIYLFAAMGFEDRALCIPRALAGGAAPATVFAIKYVHPKGANRIEEFQSGLSGNSHVAVEELRYSSKRAHAYEREVDRALSAIPPSCAVAIDISAMSKFLILVTLVRIWKTGRSARVVMTTAGEYAPSLDQYEHTMRMQGTSVKTIAGQPSSGASEILRSPCLTSTRMQGQPSCAVAFTSFNEELIRHAVGTLSPRRLLLINGMPPARDNAWRAMATQKIHSRLIEEYASDNPLDSSGLLRRTVSTLKFDETFSMLEGIHRQFGLHERMIYFATGSKMQTVALAMHRLQHGDVHIEYPTPDSYFFQEYSRGIGSIYALDLSPEVCPM